jgi:hypothetical protein
VGDLSWDWAGLGLFFQSSGNLRDGDGENVNFGLIRLTDWSEVRIIFR